MNIFTETRTIPKPISHKDLVNIAKKIFSSDENILFENYKIKVGLDIEKECIFDLGNESNIIICKASSWKDNSCVPKNIFKAWNESMYYFHLIPNNYNKIFFVKMDFSQKHCETLLQYYIRKNYFFIPKGVKCCDYFNGSDHVAEYSFDIIKKVVGS